MELFISLPLRRPSRDKLCSWQVKNLKDIEDLILIKRFVPIQSMKPISSLYDCVNIMHIKEYILYGIMVNNHAHRLK
jgi:hypothetical protein